MVTVEDYISGQESGEVTSRDRFFTICQERAPELVSKYQLARPEYAVLKFVQACDRGASGLTIVGDHSYEFWGWRGGSAVALRTRLLNPVGGLQDDALGALVMGVNSLRADRKLLIEYFPAGEPGLSFALSSSSQVGEASLGDRSSHLSPNQSLLRVRVLENQLDAKSVRMLLDSKCPFARIRYQSKADPKSSGQHSLSALRLRSAKAWEPAEAQKHETIPSWFVVDAATAGSGTTVRLLKNGVVLEEKTKPGLSGPTISICADHLTTDLGGLQFLETEQKAELISQALRLPLETELKTVELGATRSREVSRPPFLLAVLYAAALYHLAALAFNFGVGEVELVNLIATCFLINVVEFCGAFRESRKKMPLPKKARTSLHILTAISSLLLLCFWSDLGQAFRPVWFVPEFLFMTWLPLIANSLLNPEPKVNATKS